MLFHAIQSGSGLANPWISNALAENHKHLIVSLTFSAKKTHKTLEDTLKSSHVVEL